MTKRYVPKTHYTDEELLELRIQDLEVDLRCAERDGLTVYAEEVRRELARLRKDP